MQFALSVSILAGGRHVDVARGVDRAALGLVGGLVEGGQVGGHGGARGEGVAVQPLQSESWWAKTSKNSQK